MKVPKPEEGAKEAEVNTKKSRVASEERLPGFPGSTSTVYVRTEVSPNSTGQGPSPPRDDHKGVFSGPGSASYIGISKPPPPENTDSGRSMFSLYFGNSPSDLPTKIVAIAPPDKTPDYQQTPRGRDEIVLSPERKRSTCPSHYIELLLIMSWGKNRASGSAACATVTTRLDTRFLHVPLSLREPGTLYSSNLSSYLRSLLFCRTMSCIFVLV